MKKVLTTAAMLAMLAPTASAFATTQTNTVQGIETQPQQSQLQISGTVNDSSGQAPEGQISVTLPSKVSFVVDEKSNVLVAETMSITNNSASAAVSVSIASFTDSQQEVGKGITLISEEQLLQYRDQIDRSYMNLSLTATNGEKVELLSTGVTNTQLVDNIEAGGAQVGLALEGKAGKLTHSNAGSPGQNADVNIDSQGTSDTFTLMFKVAKK